MHRPLLALSVSFATPLLAQGTWHPVTIVPATDVHRPSVALGDVDGDHIEDLVLGRNGVLVVRRGTRPAPHRSFDEREQELPSRVRFNPGPVAVVPSCESAGQPRLADLDRDGDLDVVAIDAAGGAECIVWFANDGRGTFATPRDVPRADGLRFELHGELRTIDLGDVDRDGHLDLLVGTTHGATLHAGSANGFAAAGRPIAELPRGAACLADWDANGTLDLLAVDKGGVTVRRGTSTGFAPAEVLTEVAGDPGQTQLATADWNGDGKLDLLLGETVPQLAPPVALDAAAKAEAQTRLRVARQVVEIVQAEIARLNATKPPRDDPAAMAARAAWRDQLGRWVEEPRALLEAKHQPKPAIPGGRLRVALRP